MELKHIKEEIANLQALRSRDEITSYGLEKLHEYTDIVAQLSLQNVSYYFAEQYAEFCVRCDREGLPLIKIEDYLKQL